MEYKYRETEISLKYQNTYMKARKNNNEKKCFVGIDKEYRISSKDSYYDNISDMDIVLELCIYPLYLKGHTEIKDEVQKIAEEMAASNDVLEVFQVFNLIVSQEIETRIYSNVPFIIDFSKIINILLCKKEELKDEMQNYKENGFERYDQSIYSQIQKMCRKFKLIKQYLDK